MRVAIFVEQLFSSHTGERRYLANIIPALIREGKDIGFTLFHSANYDRSAYPVWLAELPPHARVVRLPLRRRSLLLRWIAGSAPADRWLGEHDIFDCPCVTPLYTRTGLRLGTIHDLAPLELPSEHTWLFRLTFRASLYLLCRRCDQLLTVSNFTAERIRQRLAILDPVPVIYHGVDPQFRLLPAEERRAGLERFDLPRPYFMFTGALSPRKNIRLLLQAFAECVVRERLDIELILTGPDLLPPGRIRSWISHFGLGVRVKYLGFLRDADLVTLLNGTLGLVFPSLYEGFGLPVIEAMACGAPVICSGSTALHEIGGPALRVDPKDVRSIATAMVNLAAGRVDRQALVRAGLQHAALFSWQAAARKKLDCYRRLMELGPRARPNKQ
jgi:glycosyltransferase involved in cell wall biosynthesis